jgi:hypothetical protein
VTFAWVMECDHYMQLALTCRDCVKRSENKRIINEQALRPFNSVILSSLFTPYRIFASTLDDLPININGSLTAWAR